MTKVVHLFHQFFARSLELLTSEVDLDGPRVRCDDPEQPYEMGKELLRSMQQVTEVKKWDKENIMRNGKFMASKTRCISFNSLPSHTCF